MSQSSESCRHNPLCCFSTSVYFCKRIFRYRLSPETFGYTLVPYLHYSLSLYHLLTMFVQFSDYRHILKYSSCLILICYIRVRGFGCRGGLGIFLFSTASKLFLGPTQAPIEWIPGALSPGVKREGVKLTTHILLVPRSRMRGAIPPLPQNVITRFWRYGLIPLKLTLWFYLFEQRCSWIFTLF
jgi:hypothetical protein